MKFRDVKSETKTTVEMVCLVLSLSGIFFQIWILATTLETYFQGHVHRLLPSMIFSFIALLVCCLTAWTTGMPFMKGVDEGRTTTYLKNNKFKKG